MAWWIEATPEPEVELDTAVKWLEGIAEGLKSLSADARARVLLLLDQLASEAESSTFQRHILAMREVLE